MCIGLGNADGKLTSWCILINDNFFESIVMSPVIKIQLFYEVILLV